MTSEVVGGVDVGEEFALGLGVFEDFLDELAPALEGAGAVEGGGHLVHGEADAGADHGVGLEAVGVEHDDVDEFLCSAGSAGDVEVVVLGVEDAEGEFFFGSEVEVEGSFGDSGAVEDFGDGGGLVAAFFEYFGCGEEDGSVCADGPVLFCHAVSPCVSWLTGSGKETA